jgi:hypothetical protein
VLKSKLNNIIQEVKNENKRRKKDDKSLELLYQPK